jgi:hypothetical protein
MLELPYHREGVEVVMAKAEQTRCNGLKERYNYLNCQTKQNLGGTEGHQECLSIYALMKGKNY